MQFFVIFEKFTRAYLFQIALEKLKLHEPLRRVQFRFLKNSPVQINSKFEREKPYDYLLIIYMKKFAWRMFWTWRTLNSLLSFVRALNLGWIITQSRKKLRHNCAIEGARLIWKQTIWLAICELLCSLTNQKACFITFYNIASRATQSNSVYVSVLQISTVLTDGVSKLLCQNFFSRERPLSARGKILYFATMMDTETRPTSPKTNTIFRPFLMG